MYATWRVTSHAPALPACHWAAPRRSAMSTHSSTWICSTSLFASGGNPLSTDTYVSLEVSEHPLPPCGHSPQCTSGQQQAHHLESDLSLPPSSLVLLLPTQHRHGGEPAPLLVGSTPTPAIPRAGKCILT